jgi:protein-disulfide isomerase
MGIPIDNFIKNDPKVKIIFKADPIFGDFSMYAAKAGLAAQKQGKFLELHNAFLKTMKPLDEKGVLEVAQKTGLNINKLKKILKIPLLISKLKITCN